LHQALLRVAVTLVDGDKPFFALSLANLLSKFIGRMEQDSKEDILLMVIFMFELGSSFPREKEPRRQLLATKTAILSHI